MNKIRVLLTDECKGLPLDDPELELVGVCPAADTLRVAARLRPDLIIGTQPELLPVGIPSSTPEGIEEGKARAVQVVNRKMTGRLMELIQEHMAGKYPAHFTSSKGKWPVMEVGVIRSKGEQSVFFHGGKRASFHVRLKDMNADPAIFAQVRIGTLVNRHHILRCTPMGRGNYLFEMADGDRVVSEKRYLANVLGLLAGVTSAAPSPDCPGGSSAGCPTC
jgi:putative lipoic acid-binding regulatory protein